MVEQILLYREHWATASCRVGSSRWNGASSLGQVKLQPKHSLKIVDTPTDTLFVHFYYPRRPVMHVSQVGANTGAISQAAIPFGGVGESGYGREGSKYGMADYQNIKVVCLGGLS